MVGDDQRGDLSVALRERLGGSALSGQGGSGGRWISMRPLRGLLDQHAAVVRRLGGRTCWSSSPAGAYRDPPTVSTAGLRGRWISTRPLRPPQAAELRSRPPMSDSRRSPAWAAATLVA